MTFTFTAVVKATAAKFNFPACCRHAKCSFLVRLHKSMLLNCVCIIMFMNHDDLATKVKFLSSLDEEL
jgi:hypothetical protein